MRKLLQKCGKIVFFLAWPAFFVYLRRAERTRVIIEHNGKILVCKNWISDNLWSLPGGGLHAGEPLLQGVVRELREETGIRVEPKELRFVSQCRYRAYGLGFTFHVFRLKVAERPDIKRQRHEVSEVAWVSPSELSPANAAADTLQALQKMLAP